MRRVNTDRILTPSRVANESLLRDPPVRNQQAAKPSPLIGCHEIPLELKNGTGTPPLERPPEIPLAIRTARQAKAARGRQAPRTNLIWTEKLMSMYIYIYIYPICECIAKWRI